MSTVFYHRDAVRSRHSVALSKPEPSHPNLHYYDLDQRRWRRCVIVDRLPYDLATYRLLDETSSDFSWTTWDFFGSKMDSSHDDNEKVIVTSSDSYRLSTDPENDTTDFEYESKWRKELFQKGKEVDVYDNGEWLKVVVDSTKADIVPGMICLSNRRYSVLSLGSYFVESKHLAESCAHTEVITPEQLEIEKEEDARGEELYQCKQDSIATFKATTKMFCHKNLTGWREMFGGHFRFYDIRDLYASLLSPAPIEITKEMILSSTDFKDVDPKLLDSPECLYIYGFFLNPESKMVFVSDSFNLKEYRDKLKTNIVGIRLGTSDALYDIRVKNATYARYSPSGIIDCDYVSSRPPIDLVKDGDDFVIPGLSLECPLFNPKSGSRHTLDTDGDVVTFKRLWSRNDYLYVFALNNHAVSWLPNGKIVMAGHVWLPSLIINEEDLVDVTELNKEKPF